MFANKAYLTQLHDANTSDKLYNFLQQNYSYRINLEPEILENIDMNRRKELYVYDTRIMDLLFFNNESVTVSDLNILLQYVISCSSTLDPNLTSKYTVLFYLLSTKEDMIKLDYQSDSGDPFKHKWELIKIFIDIYVPMDIDEIDAMYIAFICGSKHLTFEGILNGIYTYDVENDHNPAILKLSQFIHDHYLKNDCRFETLRHYHYLMNYSYKIMDSIHNAHELFSKYFVDQEQALIDIYDFVCGVSMDIYEAPRVAICSLLNNLNVEDAEKQLSVLKALFNLLMSIASLTMNPYQYNKIQAIYTEYVNSGCSDTKGYLDTESPVVEAYKKDSVAMHKGQSKIYAAYKNYKNEEDKVDSQITKMVELGKKAFVGDVESEIIEGKKFSAIGLLKKALGTAAIFSFSSIGGLVALVVRFAMRKNATVTEKRKIAMQLEAEIEMVNEKIEDARGDGDRDAKYALMRTRTELMNALKKVKYGIEADPASMAGAKAALHESRG